MCLWDLFAELLRPPNISHSIRHLWVFQAFHDFIHLKLVLQISRFLLVKQTEFQRSGLMMSCKFPADQPGNRGPITDLRGLHSSASTLNPAYKSLEMISETLSVLLHHASSAKYPCVSQASKSSIQKSRPFIRKRCCATQPWR